MELRGKRCVLWIVARSALIFFLFVFLYVLLECLLHDGWPMILAMVWPLVNPLLPSSIDGKIVPRMCDRYDWPRGRLTGTIGSVFRLFDGFDMGETRKVI